MMKSYFLILPIIFLYTITPSAAQQYTIQSKEWLKTYILSPSEQLALQPQDLQALLNILYFSYERSHATITIQPLALRVLNGLWNGWHNILATRLDPSKEMPHALCTKKEKNFELLFWQSYLGHRSISQTYNQAILLGIQGNLFSDKHAQKAIVALRDEVQQRITQALMDIKQHLYNLWNCKYADKGALQHLISFVSSNMPTLMQQSFIKVDEASTNISQEAWDFIQSIQDISNYTWEVIEQVRAEFYMAHYSALYDLMEQHAIDPYYLTIIFDENGLIPESTRQTMLPRYSQLA